MASDTEHEEPPPYDEEYTFQLGQYDIPEGLSMLDQPQLREEWADIAWQLILLAKYMDDDELRELADAVKRGPQKLGRGRRRKSELQENILHALSRRRGNGPGASLSGLKGVRRVQAIADLAKTWNMSPDAAGKAYDKAKKSLSGKKGK